jgi:hypothetical protein
MDHDGGSGGCVPSVGEPSEWVRASGDFRGGRKDCVTCLNNIKIHGEYLYYVVSRTDNRWTLPRTAATRKII